MKDEYLQNFCNHTKFRDSTLFGASIAPTSYVGMPAIVVM
jgi:hypothetical protein